jgi:hypothetical protein
MHSKALFWPIPLFAAQKTFRSRLASIGQMPNQIVGIVPLTICMAVDFTRTKSQKRK